MRYARIPLVAVAALILALSVPATAQLKQKQHVKWTAQLVPADTRAGETAQIVVTATIDDDWHIYAPTIKGEAGVPTTIKVAGGQTLKALNKIIQPEPERKKDEFVGELELYEGQVAFGVPVKLNATAKGTQTVSATVNYQTCDAHVCLPPAATTVALTLKIAPGPARANRTAPVMTVPAQPAGYKKTEATAGASNGGPAPPTVGQTGPPGGKSGGTLPGAGLNDKGLLAFILIAFGAGFAALATPCVFPMIPITVSFFAKRKANQEGSLLTGPVAYCVGIIGTFTGLGLLFAVVFGATKIQDFATSPITNLVLATLFIVMAANLFGAFEIILPSGLVNRVQSGTRAGGFMGPMMMGLAFTLTSFTCTVPFVGTLLVSASQGGLFRPIVGMLAFSTAFALPFFLLALFPQYLARMPKSGGWLVSVKAFMGFLELAAAMKFISNADLVWRWGLFTRPVFLAIWAAIAATTALYLLGWLRLPHDADGLKIGWPRRALAVASGVYAVIFLAAINGWPLGQLEAFPPPEHYPGKAATVGGIAWIPGGYEAAVRQAQAESKPIFINFTGYT
jgi:thiol:disulfide interchange protein